MDKMKMHSPDIVDANIRFIAKRFPQCITESRGDDGQLTRSVDFDLLHQELSESLVEGPRERYHLDWPGKREALLAANAPIAKTLRPIREESVDFDTTKNLFIEGDNLDALKLLQETYLGKVKMIYVDPPYNTGNDFIYNDDFKENTESYFVRSNQKDECGYKMVANQESDGRFHSAWLTMLYSRLKLARNLLSDNGVIFVSIDDGESANLLHVMNEIFGSKNFVGTFVINSTPNGRDYGHLAKMHEYVHFFCRDQQLAETFQLKVTEKKFRFSDEVGGFNVHPLYNSNEAFTSSNRPNLYYPIYLYPQEKATSITFCNESDPAECFFKIGLENKKGAIEIFPSKSEKNGTQFVWRWGKQKCLGELNKEIIGYKTDNGDYRIVQKMRHTTKLVRSILDGPEFSNRRGTAEVEELLGGKVASFPKPLELIKTLIRVGTNDSDLVMDFFAGSGTTAHAVMAVNAENGTTRSYISVQLPEKTEGKFKNIAEIAKERIRQAGNKIKAHNPTSAANLDIGFRVLKIDTSNMADVYYAPDSMKQGDLVKFAENIKPGRTPEDLLFQVLVDWGVDLSLPITQESIAKRKVFFVDGNALAACFEPKVSEELVKELAKRKPLRAVFRDFSYDSDSVKINVEQIFKLLSPETEVKAL